MKLLLAVVAFLALVTSAWGATYTVNQSGSGANYSIAQFNALTGDKGGNTYYFSGAISTPIVPIIYGTTGSYVTLDGYQAGDYNAYADDPTSPSANPARITPGSSGSGIKLKGDYDYFIIQDFQITGMTGTAENWGIHLEGTASGAPEYIVIQRNLIYSSDAAGSTRGISSSRSTPGTIVRYVTIDSNQIYNIGSTHSGDYDIKMSWASHVTITNNLLWADGTNGNSGISAEGTSDGTTDVPRYWLVEKNIIHDHGVEGGAGGKNFQDAIWRHNIIYNHSGNSVDSIGFYEGSNIYVYGNKIYNNDIGIYLSTGPAGWNTNGVGYNGVYIFSNIVYGCNQWSGILVGGYSGTDGGTNIYVYNNTLYANADTSPSGSAAGLSLRDAGGALTNVYVKNNILMYNRPNESNYYQLDEDVTTDATVSYNSFYFNGSYAPAIYWDGTSKSVAQLNAEAEASNNTSTDPGLTNPSGADFTISASTSNVVGAGTDMGTGNIGTVTIIGGDETSTVYSVPWDFALGPDTDWTATPPTIQTLYRDDLGWDQGAYVWEGSAENPPTEDNIYLFNTGGCFEQDGTGTEDLTGLGGNEQCSAAAKKEGDASLLLDGTGDGAYIADANWTGPMANGGATDAFTICGWVYVNDEANEQWITAKGSGATSAPWILYLDAGAGEADYFKWASYSGGWCGTPAASDVDVDAANWYHICVASDDTDNGDGTFSMLMRIHDVSSLIDNETGSCTAAKNAQAVTVGYNPNGPAAYWNGRIDDLRYYSYAMTADQMDSAWGSALASVGPTDLTSAAALTSAGDWTLTLVKDTEGFVSGDQPYFDLPLDYPNTSRRMYRTGKGGTGDRSTTFTGTFLVGDQLTSVQTNIDGVGASDDITVPGTWTDAQNTAITVTNCLTGLDSYPSHSITIPNTSDDPLDIAASGGDATTLAAALAAGYELANGDYILYASGTYADVINTAGAAGATIYFNNSTITGAGTWDVDCTVDGSAQ